MKPARLRSIPAVQPTKPPVETYAMPLTEARRAGSYPSAPVVSPYLNVPRDAFRGALMGHHALASGTPAIRALIWHAYAWPILVCVAILGLLAWGWM